MKEESGIRIVLGVVLVVALVAAAAALGQMSYSTGVTQAAGTPLSVPPYAIVYPHVMAPFGFPGCLVPPAFLLLVFGLICVIVWGGMGWHLHAGQGPRGSGEPLPAICRRPTAAMSRPRAPSDAER